LSVHVSILKLESTQTISLMYDTGGLHFTSVGHASHICDMVQTGRLHNSPHVPQCSPRLKNQTQVLWH